MTCNSDTQDKKIITIIMILILIKLTFKSFKLYYIYNSDIVKNTNFLSRRFFDIDKPSRWDVNFNDTRINIKIMSYIK